MWNTTKYVKVKKQKQGDKLIYRVIDKRCGICDPETAIEGLDLPCVSVDGYLDACMEYLAEHINIKSWKVQAVASVATGDHFCEHQIEIER